ncbi:caprin-2-like, partial [Ostrea edulis]|uniref:caprin-2-like n=1 Tax=Ostrea edulis TaxID=37623 RepID=UPI0024AF77DE
TVGKLESIVEKLQRDNGDLKGAIADLSTRLEAETHQRKLIEHRLLECEGRLDSVERHAVFKKYPTGQGNKSSSHDLIFREGNTPKNVQRHRRQGIRSTNGTIAFSAFMSTNLSPGHLRTLIFDAIFTNEGSGYNHHMGVFTAPRSGLFVFTWTIRANGGSYFNTQLLVNGIIHGSIYTHDYYYANSNSGTAVVYVAEGAAVYVRTGPTGNSGSIISSYDGYTTFSGWTID